MANSGDALSQEPGNEAGGFADVVVGAAGGVGDIGGAHGARGARGCADHLAEQVDAPGDGGKFDLEGFFVPGFHHEDEVEGGEQRGGDAAGAVFAEVKSHGLHDALRGAAGWQAVGHPGAGGFDAPAGELAGLFQLSHKQRRRDRRAGLVGGADEEEGGHG